MKLFKNLTMKMGKKKRILFYERLVSKIVLIENTKLFFFLVGSVYIYNLSKKKVCLNMCVYIIKMCACVC